MENYNSVDETMMESAVVDASQAPDAAGALTEALGSVAAAQSDQNNDTHSDDGLDPSTESKALRGRMKQYEQRGYNRGLRELEDARSKWEQEKRESLRKKRTSQRTLRWNTCSLKMGMPILSQRYPRRNPQRMLLRMPKLQAKYRRVLQCL